jgi:hypothetical protein
MQVNFYITDLEAVVALHLLPCLLKAPLIRRCVQEDGGRRKKTWKPTIAEMLQSFVVIVPVRDFYIFDNK